GDAAFFPLDQFLLVQLDLGDVGADRDVAAVLGAAFADMHPAAVVELGLEGTRPGGLRRRAVVVDHRAADDGLGPGGDDGFIGRAGDDSLVGQVIAPENWN